MTAPLIWLDMEMTGLDPKKCSPLEVAIVITSSNLEEISHYQTAIWQPESVLETMIPFVRDMHTNNGLLQRVRAANTDLATCETEMVQFLHKFCPPKSGILCGSSIHHDRRFLARYFPMVHHYLHYRMVDVSSLKEVITKWYGSSKGYNKPTSDHTALSDVRQSISELEFYRKNFFISQPE